MSTDFKNGLRSRGVPLPSGGIPPTGGNVFHVDSGHTAASDSGPGTDPDQPMATLDATIALCTANNGDQIWVYPGHAEAVIAAGGLDLDVAGITIIFLGNGNDRGTITFSTDVSADMDVDAADITLINPRFVAGIDALTGPIDVNAARFRMYGATWHDAASINTTDCVVADANADNLVIDGFEFVDGDAGGTQKESFIQVAGATGITLRNIKATGDFGTGVIENGTAWIDALLENIVIDNANTGPIEGIALQATSSGQARHVYVRVASGVIAVTANNDMQWFDCWGVGVDAESAWPIGTEAYNVGSWPTAATAADGVALPAVVRYIEQTLLGGINSTVTSDMHGKLGTDTELADRSMFDLMVGDGPAAYPAAPATAANDVSFAEVLHYNQSLIRDLLGSALGIQDIGNIFYIDGGSTGPADDTGAGTSRAAPKKLLQSAIDLCASGNNDVVVVLNYGSAGRALETWPVTLDQDMIHIVGVGNAAHAWAAVCPPSGDANHAIEVTGHRCTISNLCIAGGDGKAGIHVSSGAAPWGLLVRQNIFGVDNASATTLEGILIDSGGDAPYLTVLDNYFTGSTGAGGGLTGDGIKIAGNATRGRIGKPGQGNFFQGIGTGLSGILVSGGLVGMAIEGNRFALEVDEDGAAIELGGSSASCWVDGNSANDDVADATNNPFLDSSSGVNAWGLNYKGVTAQLPA